MWPYRRKFILGTFTRISSDLVWLFPPWALSEIINIAAGHEAGDSLQYFWTLMGLLIVAAIYHYTAHDIAKYLIYPIAEKMRLDSIRDAIRHMFDLDPDWHEKENTGNKLQRIDKAGDSLNEVTRLYVDLLIESTINIIGVTIILSTLGKSVNAIMLVFFLSYYLLSGFLTRRASKESLLTNIEWEKFEGVAFESLNNIATIKALGLWNAIMKWLNKTSARVFHQTKIRIFWYRIRAGSLNLYREIFRQIIIIYVVLQVFAGNIEVGVIAMVVFYFQKVSASAGELAEVTYRFELGRIAMMRMSAIMEAKPTAELSGDKPFPKNWSKLEVDDLHFSYENNDVLQGLSFSLKRGEKLGVVGLSGAGKSTLFKVLLKLYDRYKGKVLFGKRELKDIRRESYLKHFSYVPQETELFNLSLKDNVTLALDSKVNEARFKRALAVANVDDFIHKLPDGINSLIGEKGVKLSGGEKQRVGLARAIYQHPDILFLDEATSHLDAESESKIQEALHDFFQEVTAIVIAHRLSTLKEMDRILVMEDGKVIETGTFESLLKKKGRFWSLWKKQVL